MAQKCGIRAVDLPPLEQGVVSRLGAKTQSVALSEHPEITIQEYALILDIVDRGREIIDAEDGSLGGGKGSDAKEVLIFSWGIEKEPSGLF